MKNPLVQLVSSGIALGLMCGAVTIHALHVSGAKRLADSGEWVPGKGAAIDLEGGAAAIIPTALGGKRSKASGPVSGEEAATVQALQEIVARLQELKSENENLHGANQDLQEQLEWVNRDMSELQFRVDSHSESFRPMRFTSEAASLLDGSVSPGSTLHPLLPPKE